MNADQTKDVFAVFPPDRVDLVSSREIQTGKRFIQQHHARLAVSSGSFGEDQSDFLAVAFREFPIRPVGDQFQPLSVALRLIELISGEKGAENLARGQFIVEAKIFVDELNPAVDVDVANQRRMQTGQCLKKGGLAPPVAGEE